MNILQLLSACSGAASLATLLTLLFRPVRERLFGFCAFREAQRCLLRQQILNSYYAHREEKRIRQYEYENLVYAYRAYRALKGNSFIEKIYHEITEWEVTE